jgi:CDP-diacylglycerol--glycerol-3-phosphate 3-phosphatidyltransferase
VSVANLITLSRLGLVVVAFVLLALRPPAPEPWWGDWPVFGLLLLGIATDYIDGWVARATGRVTLLGRILDPLADKVLVCGALVFYALLPVTAVYVPGWAVVTVITREFLVQSVRGAAEAKGVKFGADQLGKWKMVCQCVWVLALSALVAGWQWTGPVATVFLWLSLVTTVVSGVNYVRKAWGVIAE